MDDGLVDPGDPRTMSAADLEVDIDRAHKSQDLWLKAHKEHVLDTAAEVAESGEAAEVPLKDLPALRNITKVFTPAQINYALRANGVTIEQHGLGDGRKDNTAALVPVGPAFVAADALQPVVVEAPVTRRVARALDAIDARRVDRKAARRKNGYEQHVMQLLEELCSGDRAFDGALWDLGWDSLDGERMDVVSDRTTVARPVGAHRIAGMASREKMWVERDAVVRSTSPRTGAPVLRVVEAKGQDPELFSTQQLGRGLHATLVDDYYAEDLAAGAAVETWQVHLADRSDHAHSLRIYRVEFAGDDTVFDRQVTGTFEVRFG